MACYRLTGSGKAWTVFRTACRRLLQSRPTDYWPLEWARSCGAMKLAKLAQELLQIIKKSGSEGHNFKISPPARIAVKYILSFVYTTTIHVRGVLVDCSFALLHARDVT